MSTTASLAEARRRCEFDFKTMTDALERGDRDEALEACADLTRELARLRREVKRFIPETPAD